MIGTSIDFPIGVSIVLGMDTGIAALRRAKETLTSEAALAAVVGVKQPSINYMLRKGKRVPAEWCLPIEEATEGKVTRHDLRPDLYPIENTEAA